MPPAGETGAAARDDGSARREGLAADDRPRQQVKMPRIVAPPPDTVPEIDGSASQ
jgi:hypothetical protein